MSLLNPLLTPAEMSGLATLVAYRDEWAFDREVVLHEFHGDLSALLAEIVLDLGVDIAAPEVKQRLEAEESLRQLNRGDLARLLGSIKAMARSSFPQAVTG